MKQKMKKRSKIIISSLSCALILGASTIPFIVHSTKIKHTKDNPPIKPMNLNPAQSRLSPDHHDLTPATSVFSNDNLRVPFLNTLTAHLPTGTLWTLSDIIATNIKTNTILIQGNPVTFSNANLFAIVTVNGINKEVKAKVSFDIQTQKYNIYTLNVLWNPMSNVTPGNDKISDLTPGNDKISDLTPGNDKISDLTPTIHSLTPATSVLSNDNLQGPFSKVLTAHLPIGMQWTLSDIIANNITTNKNNTNANLFAIVTVNGINKEVKAKVSFDIQTQKYNIYNLVVIWNKISNLTPEDKPWSGFTPEAKPWSGFTPAAKPWSGFTPEDKPWSGFTPAAKPWSGFTPEDKPFSNLTPAENNLTPTTSVFSNDNLQGPFSKALNSHLPIGSKWTLSEIIASDIKTNTILIQGNPVSFSTDANLFAVVTINGSNKAINAKVSFDIKTQEYNIHDLVIVWSPISNLTPDQSDFNIFQLKAKEDLVHNLANITSKLTVTGYYANTNWKAQDDYTISNTTTNYQSKFITTTLTNNTQCQYVTIRITFHNNKYSSYNWEVSSSTSTYYSWTIFVQKVVKDLNNRAGDIANEYGWAGWNPNDNVVTSKTYPTDKRSYIQAQLIDKTRGSWSREVTIHFHQDRAYTIDQWVNQ